MRTSENLQLPTTGGSVCEKSGLVATVRFGKIKMGVYRGANQKFLVTVLLVLNHVK